MKKTVVIYNSKTGFTERYARWLAEEISCELVPYARRESVQLSDYDTVVFGGWAHAGSIKGAAWLKQKLPQLAGKTVAVFVTGATPPASEQAEQALAQNAMTLQDKPVPMFYFHGGLAYDKMGAGDRLLMKLFSGMVKKQYGETSEMYQTISHSYDAASKEALAPLVEYLKERQ